ncbi:putative ribonuclease H-like domain-containing protein [Tanacetum coccineum]
MCDKKNSVLFNDTECIVLSPNFKLTDESHVLLKVPRKNNMYSVDLKNIVPKGGLTCLFAKATSDESKLWHRRLGHINFKTMNKLVKGNLVRGLPSKLFENNQTCVACQKGKQHRASCKSKTVSSISQPLHMLHMDLFGPTFVKSLMKKMYCLVVIDDYSRFSWVFFLATKDETSGILKSFITGVENLIDQRVKVIRCDNGTEFKNKETNHFYERKGIKREFSVARTPQQNRVAERKNRTLIKAGRTMLVTKPHNKTSYELFLGRNAALGFMRPFGCPVIILNTIDHLGKFDGKVDEGFFVGYSIKSKAFRHVMMQSSPDDGFKPSRDDKKVTKELGKEGGNPSKDCEGIDQEKEDSVNSTNNVNVASINKVNAVGGKTSIDLPLDLNMPLLEDIVYSDDDEYVGVEADMNNLDAFMHEEPKKVIHALKDPSWIEAMVRLVRWQPPRGALVGAVTAQGALWFWSNHRMGEFGFVETDKWIEDQLPDDRKGHFMDCIKLPELDGIIFGSTKKSLCNKFEKMMHKKFQMSSIGELIFFLGLQVKQNEDGIFISQDKYVTEILKKFGFTNVKATSTHMETQKLLLKDEDGEEVDVHLYRSIIGSLMYLTSSRPDIMFAVCACARYQVNPKVLHLHAVKRIFRYLKGQPKLGLWYIKDSPFDLVAYTDSDYAGASLDKKSTKRVNAARHNLLLLLKVNAARHNLLLLLEVNAARHKLTTAVES